MKYCRLTIILALVLVVAGCQCETCDEPHATFTPEDDAAIRAMLVTFVDTVVAEDWATNADYYTADAVRMPPDAPMIQGHEAMLAMWDAYPPVTGFTLSPAEVGGSGDLAWARGAFTLDMAPPDADPINMIGKWQATYQRQEDGSWLCVSDIWNMDAPSEM